MQEKNIVKIADISSTTQPPVQTPAVGMKVKSRIKAGWYGFNHNETIV